MAPNAASYPLAPPYPPQRESAGQDGPSHHHITPLLPGAPHLRYPLLSPTPNLFCSPSGGRDRPPSIHSVRSCPASVTQWGGSLGGPPPTRSVSLQCWFELVPAAALAAAAVVRGGQHGLPAVPVQLAPRLRLQPSAPTTSARSTN